MTLRSFSIPLLLLAITVGACWKVLLTKQYTYLDSPDLTYQVAPWIEVQARAWHSNDFPLLWDPYIAGGQSLIGQVQPATAYPLYWLLFLAPLRHGFLRLDVLHWYMALVHFLAALTGYALCRDLNRSRSASVLAAIGFSFGGYMGSMWWPQLVNAVCWVPLTLMFSLRAIRGAHPVRNAFFSGIFLGIEWLGGHHQIPVITLLAIAGLWIFHVAQGTAAKTRVSRARQFAILLTAMMASGALQLFPAYSYGHDAVRWATGGDPLRWNEAIPYSVHEKFSEPASAPLGTFADGIFANIDPFLGVTIVSLAILGVILGWNEFPVRLLAVLAVGGLLISFGGATLLDGLLYAVVPFVEKMRSPAVGVFLFQLGACPLAAFGVDKILENPRCVWIPWAIRWSIAVGGVLWVATGFVTIRDPQVDFRLGHLGITALAALLFAALLAALRNGAINLRQSGGWFVALVLLEIGTFPGIEMRNRDAGWPFWPLLERDRDVARYLKSRPGWFRIDAKDSDVPYNFGDWYGIETYLGYLPSMPEIFTRVDGTKAARRLLGVRYSVAKAPEDPAWHEVMSGAGGIKVFELPAAMPRAWIVHEAISNLSAAQMLDTIDVSQTTVLETAAPQLEVCSGDRADVIAHRAQSVVIQAQMSCRGMLILGDVWSKDWIASVDGKPVEIYRAYSFLRGVVVDPGTHQIEFRYRPVSVMLGAMLTFPVLIGALAYGLFFKRDPIQPPVN